MARDFRRIEEITSGLRDLWSKPENQDLRFFQMLFKHGFLVENKNDQTIEDPFHYEDEDLIHRLDVTL